MQGPITTFGSGGMPGSIGTLDKSGKPNIRRFYGKYRGKVADNIDPLFLGRILPIVPAVSDLPLTWATPCVPYAGLEVGLCAIPPIDANVWIEFEGGDPDYPIWTGCFWEEGQTPLGPLNPETFIFKTTSTTFVIREARGWDQPGTHVPGRGSAHQHHARRRRYSNRNRSHLCLDQPGDQYHQR